MAEQPETYTIEATVALCRHCQRRIVRVNFALGARWMHQPEGSAFQDNMYDWCHITTAGPPNPDGWEQGQAERTAEIPL